MNLYGPLQHVANVVAVGLATWLLLHASVAAAAGTCTFNTGSSATNFGAINPTGVVTKTFSRNIAFNCTQTAVASFTVTGANDTGIGAYRMKHNTQAGEFMPYTITQTIVPATRITLAGQLTAANYQDAYFGNYTDTLTVTISP